MDSNPATVPDTPVDEADTCRICRTEGTADEPLFHPCKCSGSIGYVHQECLMEWLSHSQKKHCELCKTSFRFTKLYDPNMPQALPTWIFLQRASLHLLSATLTWMRALLVFATWFIWLPWSMRFVWWGLFWIADGGFSASSSSSSSSTNATLTVHVSQNKTTYSIPTADATSRAFGILQHLLPWPKRSTVSDPPGPLFNQSTTPSSSDRQSLLSGISLLTSLTPSPAVNAFITDILEGGIIALSVVATFILIFLIREWVVQQQPQANLAALDDIDVGRRIVAAAGAGPAAVDPAVDQAPDAPQLRDPTDEDARDASEPAPNGQPSETTAAQPFDPQRTLNDVLKELTHLFELIQTVDSSSMQDDDFRVNILQRLENNLQMSLRAYNSLLDTRGVSSDQAFNDKAVQVLQAIISRLPDASRPELEHQLDLLVQRLQLTSLQRLATTDEDSLAPAATDSDDAAEGSSARPAMPDRALSSLGTDVRRELEESSNRPPSPQPRTTLPPLNTRSTTHDDHEDDGWDTMDSDDESVHQIRLTPQSASSSETTAANGGTSGQAPNGDVASVGSTPAGQTTSMDSVVHTTVLDRVLVWLWDEQPTVHENSDEGQDDEHVVEDLDAEPPFVPVADARANRQEQPAPAQNDGQDPEVIAAAAQAGINPNEQDIQDDVEDLEGLMELIGMQGPLIGLFQNAIFTAVVISATVSIAVWFPYLWGKAVLLMIAYPLYALTLPYRFLEGAVAFCMDTCIWFICGTVAWFDSTVRAILSLGSSALPFLEKLGSLDVVSRAANKHATRAITRLSNMVASSADAELAEYVHFSLSSHIALRRIQSVFKGIFVFLATGVFKTFQWVANFKWSFSSSVIALNQITRNLWYNTSQLFGTLAGLLSSWRWTVSIDKTLPASSLDQSLAHWNTADRSIAILVGYGFFALAGAVYLARLAPLSSSPRSRKLEDVLIEILQQAGGVLKVILIISIEMLAFPLYCGFLLDFAMLPLFGDASFTSRIAFTVESPWASTFIHWFIGTCYMFHFALFVSMCRKIMRKGVLYFIRDPDDPTFHPIRDVLERSVTSQLRKIAFSALIYGGLVIVCLGSIVWLLAGGISGILPIKWMPVKGYLGFPLDLLLYSLLKPFAVRYLTPSNSLHVIYEWWFRRCARQLRLSNFMFGDHRDDELRWADQSEKSTTRKLVNGRFVRAPASDQVRVPRGQRVFLEVTEDNVRVDGQEESEDPSAVHGPHNENFRKVYVPSWFRMRIAAFIFCLWMLTAAVGIGLTVVPLVVGRLLFSLVLPDELWASDIYAFSVGMGLGSALIYGFLNHRKVLKWSKTQLQSTGQHLRNLTSTAVLVTKRMFSVAYVYGALVVIGPALLALLAEFYVIGPVHAYLAAGGSSSPDAVSKAASSVHVVRLAQDWTLGVQYLRVVMQIVSWAPQSRMSRALRRVVVRGWLHPDAALATRGFILPSLVLFSAAMLAPTLLGQATIAILSRDRVFDVHIMRLAYPALLVALLGLWILSALLGALTRWKSRIRDEVYLIGERLHNFGEPAAGPRPASASVSAGGRRN